VSVRDDCKGRLVTKSNKGNPQLHTAHSHVASEDEVRVQRTREQLRLRAANETAPITQIYRQEVQGLVHHPGAAARMPAYESVAATMYKDRPANMPQLPVSLRTLVVPPQYQQTLTGQPFLMSLGPGINFLLFSTVDNLTRLCQAHTIYKDGTFDAVPRMLFSQLYSVHAFVDTRLIPFVYVLLKVNFSFS
jgi:hypothetical protein